MANTSNWIIIGALVLLVAITAIYFVSNPAGVTTSTGAAVPAIAPAPAATTGGTTTTGN